MKRSFKVSYKAQIEVSWTNQKEEKTLMPKYSFWLSIVDSILSIVTSIKQLF